jgi:DNA-binding NarL/FixJ family response regulator
MASKSNPTKVLVVDDHPILRQGLTELLNQQPDFEVCGQAAEVSTALTLIEKTKPEIAILDLSLNGSSGIELLKDIKVRFPKLIVLVLSMHDETVFAPRALKAGALGYVMKQEGPEKILKALRTILKEQVYLSDRMGARMLSQLTGNRSGMEQSPIDLLSDRELQVFSMIGQGCSTRMIAEKIHLSVKTVESHRAHIKEKLHLKDSTELVHHAIQWAQTESLDKPVRPAVVAP